MQIFSTPTTLRVIQPILFVLLLLPFVVLLWQVANDQLGANPLEALTRETGIWALRILLLTLCVTPLRQLTGWSSAIKLRRMLGLYAFFYACLHFLTYLWFDQFFNIGAMLNDIVKRPFITVGFVALLLMLPLAVTSNNAMVRRLGGKLWQQLHRLIYLIAIAAVLHFWWLAQSKIDIFEPFIYAFILFWLLLLRHPTVMGYALILTGRQKRHTL